MPEKLPNPWGRSVVDLSKHVFSISEKQWFISEIADHGKKSSDLAKRNSLDRNLLNRWVARYRKNGRVHGKGRPTIIGSPIIKELKDLITNKIHNKTTTAFVEDLQM